MCGERFPASSPQTSQPGSAPRVRGTGSRPLIQRAADRFSPACAGNGTPGPMSGSLNAGSAPRVRGTDRLPAPIVHRVAVQPRVCGERWVHDEDAAKTPAVQPRVCGERRDCSGVIAAPFRFSPACAGNGRRARRITRRMPGSAPRVRGTAGDLPVADVRPRFSPACAGNGPARRSNTQMTTVQPRVCGERLLAKRRSVEPRRFSPACAGNGATLRYRPGDGDRFSPACAGNGQRCAGGVVAAVQPRVCGERS